MTFGIVLIKVLVILLFHVWHGPQSSDRQLQVGKGRTMQDLLCKYVALFSVRFVWFPNLFGVEMPAFHSNFSYTFHYSSFATV